MGLSGSQRRDGRVQRARRRGGPARDPGRSLPRRLDRGGPVRPPRDCTWAACPAGCWPWGAAPSWWCPDDERRFVTGSTSARPPVVRLVATALVAGGAAVARQSGGRVVLVEGALPGETVDAVVTSEHASYARASVVEVLEASPDRVSPPCPNVARGAAAAVGNTSGCPLSARPSSRWWPRRWCVWEGSRAPGSSPGLLFHRGLPHHAAPGHWARRGGFRRSTATTSSRWGVPGGSSPARRPGRHGRLRLCPRGHPALRCRYRRPPGAASAPRGWRRPAPVRTGRRGGRA